MKKRFLPALLGVCIWSCSPAWAQTDLAYQTPPKEIVELLDAPSSQGFTLNPTNTWGLLVERGSYPSIEELAQPEMRLAGIRFNPRNNGRSRAGGAKGFKTKNITTLEERQVTGLPANALFQNISWSPDGLKIAVLAAQEQGIALFVIDVATAAATQLTDYHVNYVVGNPFAWFSDSKTILYKQIPADRGNAPAAPSKPAGPIVQETGGKRAASRTYPDLLKNKYDEAVFDYYATAQLTQIDLQKQAKQIGKPALYLSINPSPDANYILVGKLARPYSYLVPYTQYPRIEEVWNRNGEKVREVANLPLAEDIPQGNDAVRKGVRGLDWRPDKPATLVWAEALDGGDFAKEMPFHDQLYALPAPFAGEPQATIKTPLRFGGCIWGNGEVAIVYQGRYKDRKFIVATFAPDKPAQGLQILQEGSSEDRYNFIGSFITQANAQGRQVLAMNGDKLYLRGEGASPEGNKPFLDEYSLKTRKATRLWRSAAPYYAVCSWLIDPKKNLMIISRESKEENPNYFLLDWKKNTAKAITTFPHPYPQLKGVEKMLVKYKRKDGVDLQGTLYLPKGWKKGDAPLPMLMWAYPDEYKSKANAGQVQGSPYEFTSISWGSPLFWVTQGYAVLDDASMPIVGEGEAEPNDTFIEQLVSNADAAITYLSEQGYIDRKRVAVGGHSYGAFMTANLLIHSDLFVTGIARSGAYNRTLTPFGFQSEERTYWQAPKVYYDMSPFSFADKLNEPLLIIHGEADNNPGTFPIQSERFYNALKGLGKSVRYVVLPHESHGYQARESIMHMAWEMSMWLDKHLKK